MPLPIPTIGSTNVRGFLIDAVWNTSSYRVGQTFECLESLYGNQKPDFNPLIFSSAAPTGLEYGTEVLFDIVDDGQRRPIASNVRVAG
jgi:hypothetical protein